MAETTLKWNEQPHKHVCPLHGDRFHCEDPLPCQQPYALVCGREHSRELLQKYVDRQRQQANKDAQDWQREARDAYRAGREDRC